MDQSYGKRDFILGLMFFGTISLLIYYTVALTGFSFEEKPMLKAYFPNAQGLKEGDSVLVVGMPTGRVTRVAFDDQKPEDRRIEVSMEMTQKVTIRRGYRMRITEFTLLGGRVVEIDPGRIDEPPLPPGTEFLGSVGISALESLGDLVEENRENISATLSNLRSATDQLAQGKGVLGGLFYDESMRKDLSGILDNARRVAEDLREGRGALGALISDPETRDRIVDLINDGASAVVDLRQIAEDLAAGRGTLGALLSDETMRSNATELVSNLNQTSDSLRRMLDEADQGRGLLGRLISDEDLSKNASTMIADLSEVSRRLREGEGSLGHILAQDEAYDELLKALKLLNGQLEDVREAQPVSSFATILFGAF